VDLLVLILGVTGIVRAKFPLSKGRFVEGNIARTVGSIVTIGPVLAVASGFVIGWVFVRQKQGVTSFTPEEILRLDTIAMAVNAGIVIVSLVIALVIARKHAQESLTESMAGR
jgi:hypothetical protein